MSQSPPDRSQKITARILELRRIHASKPEFQMILDALDESVMGHGTLSSRKTQDNPDIFTRIERLLP